MEMPLPIARRLLAIVTMLVLSGCAAPRPVLYPDDYYQAVGQEQAEADIEDCMARAEREGHGADGGAKVAGGTAVGAGAGAAGGAATGAIFGSAGRGAATGAVGGAVAGLIGGLLRAGEPSTVNKRFVERCLADRGYDTIGWE